MPKQRSVSDSMDSLANEHLPAVSIGMPVFNGAKYIREALDSLLTQTFSDFELIISDNASTDETQTICEEYAQQDSRIRYVRQSENRGALANFQFVLDKANSDYFMWAAADDRWDEHWINSIFPYIAEAKCIAAFGQLTHIDANSAGILHPANGARLKFGGMQLSRKLAFYLAYEGMGKANLFYAIYPRKVLQSIDLRNYRFDYQIIFALLDQISYVQVDDVSLYKRIHGESGGLGFEKVRQLPVLLEPVRVLWRDARIATHYLQYSRPGLRIILLALIPIKLLVGLGFHVMKRRTLFRNKLSQS